MNDIVKTIQALEDANIVLKEATKTIKNETKEQKGGFLSMLLDTLGAIFFLGNLLAGKGIVRAGSGNKKGKRIVRAGYEKEWISNAASSFSKLWNTIVLSKLTMI